MSKQKTQQFSRFYLNESKSVDCDSKNEISNSDEIKLSTNK